MTPENENDPHKEIEKLTEQLSLQEIELAKLRGVISAQEQYIEETNEASEDDNKDDHEEEENNDVSLKEILENPEVTKIINTAVNAWASTKPDEMKLRFRSLHLGLTFSLLVFVVIGVLGYVGVLSKDVTGSLLGALIGYWYGRQQAKG
jgi:uncharacterized membrane protein